MMNTLWIQKKTQSNLKDKPTYVFIFMGDDKAVTEYNEIIRNYYVHLSGVYCLALHPTLDLVMSGWLSVWVCGWINAWLGGLTCMSLTIELVTFEILLKIENFSDFSNFWRAAILGSSCIFRVLRIFCFLFAEVSPYF